MKPGSGRPASGGASGRAATSATAAYAQWHQHPIYDRYWRYHERAVLWLQQHAATVRHIRSAVADRSPDSVYAAAASYRQTVVGHRAVAAAAPPSALAEQEQQQRRFAGDLCAPAPPRRCPSGADAAAAADEDDDVEFQVTPELVAFLAHSHQHRKQRDAEKVADQSSEAAASVIGHIDACQTTSGSHMRLTAATSKAPKEQPGTRRTHEMKMLYGDGAALIHGMETAAQLRFDTGVDRSQPVHWPHLPLRIPLSSSER